MLVELVVENYAVIEKVRVRFHPGLNLLTGETGSGKSIVVDALGLLLGGRASSEMVRTGAQRARIAGIFEVASPALARLLESAGLETEDGELLIEREILANGKSRAFVANRPATAALLRDLAPHLGDIHGQHDQQRLFTSSVQCDFLDDFARVAELLDCTSDVFRRWRDTSAELEELDRTAQEKLRLADLWSFQSKEIDAVAPQEGEDEKLENERRVLRNVVRLEEAASAAYQALYDAPDSVSTRLKSIARKLEDVARIDATLAGIHETLKPAAIAADEASHALRHYLGALEADPARLEQVESRLAALEKLKRKYGATIAEVLTFLEDVRRQLAAVESSSERREALGKAIAELASEYELTAAKLTARRTEAARDLARRVETELAALAMPKTRVEIRVVAAAWSEHGSDAVEFLISPNPGEEPKPLDKIASGGELSRVALALMTAAMAPAKAGATRGAPSTLVFDEIDAGVGGSAAEAVGRRLKKLGRSNQVLCVTHLAQIAGFADHHYYVEKQTARGRTLAAVEELSPEQRTREIGRMLSGERVTPEALRHAAQLMKAGTE
ncbi:MAG TPA: DNA repair protein RecN [Bryobacteraceae bacterium]|nr:DNA repair protein RecN [Bryobacteraceae bacterium]